MRIIITPEYQEFQEFFLTLPTRFNTEGTLLYQGRNVVKRFTCGPHTWIVKRYKKPNFIQRLAYSFWRKSKAERAFLYAERLLSLGIDTPQGIAYIECRRNGLLDASYFISTECNYPPLLPILVKQPVFDKRLAAATAAFFVSMHAKGFFHGDPNLSNILYHTDETGQLRFSVIDTNRSIFKAAPTQQECLENLKRVTHRRDLLQYITEEYAALRQWDVSQSVKQVTKALDKFEQRKRVKRMLLRKK